ncbi:MAG: hypothetical protein G01um10147_939 [Microgenomates group bacterium Gr01-1014_7]|nr:MAG: hypothetical protein G01um10147_939 [Microgenomates group bacterium Gr01-1014_7]
MAIQQTKKQSDLEKRLRLLRQQVYGKDKFRVQSSEFRIKDEISTNYKLQTTNFSSDISYLHQDLLKISLLAGSALGLQIILFILSKNHILNLNFF